MKTIPYGSGALSLPSILSSPKCNSDIFDLPKETICKIDDIKKEIYLINKALSTPIDRKQIEQWVSKDSNIVILIPDITRKCPTELLLDLLIPKIDKNQNNIKIIVATGNHRDVTKAEMKAMVGESTFDKYEILNHNSDGKCTYIGKTSRGNEVYINSLVAKADKVILIGTANFHTFAGYSGSRKSILPGVSARSTIMYNHKLMINKTKLNNKTNIGIYKGNPINEDMIEAINLFGVKKLFLLNVVTNVHTEIIGVYTGCPIKAFDHAIAKVNISYSQKSNKKYDVIICSAGGSPSDKNFYQSGKTIELYYEMVKDNGHLLVVAQCEDGIGENEDLYKEFCALKGQQIIDRLRSHYHNLGTTPYKIDTLLNRGCKIYLVTDYDASMADMLGIQNVKSIDFQHTIEKIIQESIDETNVPDIAVIPYGCLTAFKKD